MIATFQPTRNLGDDISYTQPPLPPIDENDGKEDNRELIAILNWEGKSYSVSCKSRRFNLQFSFQHPELGEVIFAEDGNTLLFSQKILNADIYKWMCRKIQVWIKSFPDF